MTAIMQEAEPNLFNLEGGGINVSYSVTSFGAVPLFSYTDQKRSVNRTGDEIRTDKTDLGTLVTVDVEQVPDLHTISFTLVVPRIRLAQGARSSAIHTIGVLTTNRTGIEPQTIVGQVQSYQALTLCGTAQLVES
jgi:hypothetical protein